jgi:hypothetical protein
LQAAGTEAIDALKRNLTCGTPAAEVQAAKAILDFTLKVREQFDHGHRIKQLEDALKAREEAEAKRALKSGEEDDD